VYALSPPLVIIGSAGSGKTALTLEKMKQATGNVLYITQSEYLVKNSRELYCANHYGNDFQEVDFLSFQEFLETIEVPHGKSVTFTLFKQWYSRHQQSQIKDAHKLFEEFRGVLTGSIINTQYLSRSEYLNLGVKQSIFLEEERNKVYDIFEKYLKFLTENNLYDSNLVSYDYLKLITPHYDFVIIDEVQDLTNIQLYLILKSLKKSNNFILCGDSNQIVHPNFFSWTNIKRLLSAKEDLNVSDQLISVLNTNYRNSPQLTEIANRILKIKNLRFGSIDKESHYLIKSNGHNNGEVVLLENSSVIREELNSKTKASILFAVIVLNESHKELAREHFNTPLVFTIQEAKGLEYENIILYDFLSHEIARYREIADGVNPSDLNDELKYSRSKDKTDKSSEVYKFYINALYVAITRAIKNLYWIETNTQQSFLHLLDLDNIQSSLELANQNSDLDAWRLEARKLELQGKQEQADLIKSGILNQQTPPWEVMTTFNKDFQLDVHDNEKEARLKLFEYGLIYLDTGIFQHLYFEYDFKPIQNMQKGIEHLKQKHFGPYNFKKTDQILKQINLYGLEFKNAFNQTPLIAAAWIGNIDIVKMLCEMGADKNACDANGLTAFHIALMQASRDGKYAKNKLPFIYDLLVPDSISIQIDNKLIKIDNHRPLFFIINMMMSIFYNVKPTRLDINVWDIRFTYDYFCALSGISIQGYLDAVKHIPVNILPEHRKNRQHITAALSGNEIDKENGKKLFMRIKRGEYLFNHKAIVKHADESLDIYTKLGSPILGNILDSKINNPKYEEAILEKFTKHENGNPVHLEYDFMPLSYNELEDIISKRLSREDVLLNNRLKRLGLL
jgi:superfamily I DNA/RNA helicase